MEHRVYQTSCGPIHYWLHILEPTQPTLVFLPGLTADQRLFDKQIEYFTAAEIWLLKRMEPVYRYYPWKWLLWSGAKGVAVTDYGRALMQDIMMTYNGDQERYARLSGHGFRMLAEAMEGDLPCAVSCPALLICCRQDHAGSCIRYNKTWHSGIPIVWLDPAGHNSNTDQPDRLNHLLEDFLKQVHI